MSTTYIEADVICISAVCEVKRIRRSLMPHPPSVWTFLDGEGCKVWPYFSRWFVEATNPRSSCALPTITQGYIMNPDAPTAVIKGSPAIWRVGKEHFAQRFAQLLNTLWLTCVGFTAITDDNTVNARWLAKDANLRQTYSLLYNGDVMDFANRSLTSAHPPRSVEVVQCHKGWLFALLLMSGILMLSSLVPAAVRLLSRAPTFELNVSTSVRE